MDKLTLLADRAFWPGRYEDEAEALSVPPNMLKPQELCMLHWLGKEYCDGSGVIVDLGTFLGGDVVAFGRGVRKNDRLERGRRWIHAYDLFQFGPWEERSFENLVKDRPKPEGGRFRQVFDDFTREVADLIEVHEGDIVAKRWVFGPIDILFVDCAKSAATNDHVLRSFLPSLTMERGLLIHQDYLYNYLPWLHVSTEALSHKLERIVDTDIDCVVWRLTEPLTKDDIEQACFLGMGAERRVELMDRAIARERDETRGYLENAKKQLLTENMEQFGAHYHTLTQA